MRTLVGLAAVMSFACATGGTGVSGRLMLVGAAASSARYAPSGQEEVARRTFPALVSEAKLSRADRLAHRVRAEYAGRIGAEVRLCLGPDGRPEYVNLLTSSGMVPYDVAVVETLSDWQFTPYRAPAGTRVCQNFQVIYVIN